MVQLVEADIQTREVLDWRGIHLFHFPTSSCSQKTRIVLELKGVPWESQIVNLSEKKNNDAWFLGINPRGLIPVLVHDGAVHIESNDILMYLEERFPKPELVPGGCEREVARLLKKEDDLHHDIRNLTMRYIIPPELVGKTPEVLENYRNLGSGTVAGEVDARRQLEVDYWHRLNVNGGITDEAVRQSADRLRREFNELENILSERDFLYGDTLSLVDVAWFIYTHRMNLLSYPMETQHPRVHAWFERLKKQPAFAKEIVVPDDVQANLAERRARESSEGRSFHQIAAI
jgi:ganglioside-induced differentiation-associated protein 1